MSKTRKILMCVVIIGVLIAISQIAAFADFYSDFENYDDQRVLEFEEQKVMLGDGDIMAFSSQPVKEGKVYIGMDVNYENVTAPQVVSLISGNQKYSLFGAYAGGSRYNEENVENDWQPGYGGNFVPELGEWVHYDVLIDFDNATIEYYKDSSYWGAGIIHSNVLQDGFRGIRLWSEVTEPGSRCFYIDNVIIGQLGDLIQPRISEVNTEDRYIDVNMGVALADSDLSAMSSRYIHIGAESDDSGTEITLPNVTSVSMVNKYIARIEYDSDTDSNYEYYVEIPDTVVGIFDQKMGDNKAYFLGNGNPSVISEVYLKDLDGKTIGFSAANDEICEINFKYVGSIRKVFLDEIKLYVDGELLLPTETISANNVYTMKFSNLIGAEKSCVITIPELIVGVTNSKRSFVTGEGKFELKSFNFTNDAGETAESKESASKLSTGILNTSAESRNVYLLYAAYDENGKMTSFKITAADVSGNYCKTEIPISADMKDTVIKGFILEEKQLTDGSYVRLVISDSIDLTL